MDPPRQDERAMIPWPNCFVAESGFFSNVTLMRRVFAWLLIGPLFIATLSPHAALPPAREYAVVVSRKTGIDPLWQEVVAVLVAKHQGDVIHFDREVMEALPELRARFPRHVCFVAQPEEATRSFVAAVHRLSRSLDDDPYADCFWGILTGYDAGNARRIAAQSEPLTIRKAAAGTEIALDAVEQGVWFCELTRNKMVRKEPGQPAVEIQGPEDTTQALVDTLNEYHADLFVTSGHATERDWSIGYRYRNGAFKCADGQLFGVDTQNRKLPIHSPNPKVYLPVGNCLMGHIDQRDCMALAWMNNAGVCQMFGYTVPTWYGYLGWGVLDYFVEQPGRYTLTEAFFANHHALVHRLAIYFPELLDAEVGAHGRPTTRPVPSAKARAEGLTSNDGRGLLFDRDVVAFYGDPQWPARMATGPRAFDLTLAESDGVFTFEVKPNRGADSFQPVNTNGSQRGWRPFVAFLPYRIGPAQIIEGADLEPVIADDFVLVPNPRVCDPGRSYRVVFRAR